MSNSNKFAGNYGLGTTPMFDGHVRHVFTSMREAMDVVEELERENAELRARVEELARRVGGG
jgi:hypothetical protein